MQRFSQYGLVFLVVAGLWVTACGTSDVAIETNGFVKRHDALSLGQTSMDSLVDVYPNGETGLTLAFKQTDELRAIRPDTVLVGIPSPLLPEGFLVRVKKIVSHRGMLYFRTIPATLQEAIAEGRLEASFEHEHTEVTDFVPLVKGVRFVSLEDKTTLWTPGPLDIELMDVVVYDADQDPATTADQVRISGSVGIVPRVDLDVEIDWSGVRHFELSSKNDLYVDIDVEGTLALTGERTLPVAKIKFAPVVAAAGPIPLVFTSTLILDVGIHGKISATVRIGARVSSAVGAGIVWDGAWRGYWDTPTELADVDFSIQRPDIDPTVTVGAHAGVSSNFRLYGVAGPMARAKASIAVVGDREHYEVRGGLSGHVGLEASIPIIDHTMGRYTKPFEFDWLITEGAF